MELRSLGYRTDLFFCPLVTDRGSYLVVRTPDNPGYHWGNFLLFDRPPGPGALEAWFAAFETEIASKQATDHRALAWDGVAGEMGDVQPFVEQGMDLERSVVLTSESPRPPPRPQDTVTVRPLTSAADWDQALENQIACRDLRYELGKYRAFKQNQMQRYRALSEAGKGTWFGGFLGDRLVADLGIYHAQGIGRYQAVGTHPAHRRQGICGTLVHQAGAYARAQFGVKTLVLVADPDDQAARVYQSVGFAPTEQIVALHSCSNC